jgi:hypothetical protein
MDQKRFNALRDAIEPDMKQLEPFRDELAAALRAYHGPHYNGRGEDRPINMLQMAVENTLQQLSSRAPQVLCITHLAHLKPSAAQQELAINETLKRIRFEQEHRLWTLSAIFSVGIMKVGLEINQTPEIDDEPLPMTSIFCEAIMLDDFVFDMSASKWDKRQVTYCGNRYRMPLAEAKANTQFKREVREKLTAKEKTGSGKDRTSALSKPDGATADPFTDMVELWDVWVPDENEILTFSVDGKDEPLQTIKWHGPPRGPYHLLGFNPVLNNIMPLAPVANWIDLDDLENKLYSKLGQQASRQKTIGITDLQSVVDGQNIIKTSDGDVLAVGSPGSFKEARFGGVDQQTLGFALNVKSMCDFVMGNLTQGAGLGASAGTLGQEQLIKQAANIRIASMQSMILTATTEVVRDITFWLHHHPTVQYDMTMPISGTDIELPITWPRQNNEWGEEVDVRRGQHDDYQISIQPYSMQDVSPGQRAQMLRNIWREDILPTIAMGVQPDVYAYLEKLSKYYDLPELSEIVPMMQTLQPPQGGGGGMLQPGKPNGNYTRSNVSMGMTPQAEQQQQGMMMLSGKTAESGVG